MKPGESSHVLVIAEAGVNHNGSVEVGCSLVDAAADAGADAVKFQTFRADRLVSRSAPKAPYQTRTTDEGESQFDMLRKLEIDAAFHQALIARCRQRGIEFLSTAFDEESLALLVDAFDVGRLKIPSGELTNGPLLLRAAGYGRPIILSTGMGTLEEVEVALGVLAFGYTRADALPGRETFAAALASAAGREAVEEKVALLHCTTEYPTPTRDINLAAMGTLRDAFGLSVGLSDHSEGWIVAVAAVACGARIVEKHLTLDRSMPGPDHQASIEPEEFARMVSEIRRVETAIGSGDKTPRPSEQKNLPIARKSLVALRAIAAGDKFCSDNLGSKRPGVGRSPMEYWDLLGARARREYAPDELIDGEDGDMGP